MATDSVIPTRFRDVVSPSHSGSPTLRLLDALRRGEKIEIAAKVADLPPATAAIVANSPLIKALSGRA